MCATIIKGTPEDKEKLPQIISEHKEWLADHNKGRQACLKDMNLEGADLSGVDLSYADLSGSCFRNAKLVGTKLTGANLHGADLGYADLSKADLTNAQMSSIHTLDTRFEEASMQCAVIRWAVLWDSDFKGANLKGAILTGSQLCDCSFKSANLDCADLYGTNLDYASFEGASLRFARVDYADNSYYAGFSHADVTGVVFSECNLDEESFEGAIGFHPHMRCPEEGSFIAWKKCRDDRIVKLLIPADAKRTGASVYTSRASEARVLEIWNQDGEPCEEAVSCADESFIYRKGETVHPKEDFDDHLLEDGSGIHFALTRTEAEQYEPAADDPKEDDEVPCDEADSDT